MSALDNLAEEIKKTAKKNGKEISDDEAQDGARNLVDFFKLLWDLSIKDAKKKKRLKKEPDGFPVDGNYSCSVCGININESTGWYDWYGNTCFLCRKAIKDGIVPSFVCTDRNSYYVMWKLDSSFGFKYQTVKKMVREGKLFPRIVTKDDGKPYTYIFLKKENPNLVDPDRHNPMRKSYDRNRGKRANAWERKTKIEWREECKKEQEKINKILK
jgi:hypothetical protein